MFWKWESITSVYTNVLRGSLTLPRLMMGGLLLALLTLSACQQDGAAPTLQGQNGIPASTSSPTPIAQIAPSTPTSKPVVMITPTPQASLPLLCNP